MAWPHGMTKDVWGPIAWKWIHRTAIQYRGRGLIDAAYNFNVLHKFLKSIPCSECKTHALNYLFKHKPDLTNSETYQTWAFNFHNDVNKRLGKTEMTWAAYKVLYQDDLAIQELEIHLS